MSTLDVKQCTATQMRAVITASCLIEGGPRPGKQFGTGKQVPMPATCTVDDLASGDVRRWIGWTGAAVQAGQLHVTDVLKSTLDGTAVDVDGKPIDPSTIVKDAKMLADAKAAVAKATQIAAIKELAK